MNVEDFDNGLGTASPALPPTEQVGPVGDLESRGTSELVAAMHEVECGVDEAVEAALPAVAAFVEALVPRLARGGRLFYIGAGTSGRLGIVDASECPPTFGVPPGRVVGLIAGGDAAIREAVEGAEDDAEAAWRDLAAFRPGPDDTLVGIAASGRTPYVLGGVRAARAAGLLTAAVTCNPGTALAAAVDHPIEAVTGPEFVTGSTRLKAGSATKRVLNLITTVAHIRLGHVRGTRMVDMRLSNRKLHERALRTVRDLTGCSEEAAAVSLAAAGSVRGAVDLLTSSHGAPPTHGVAGAHSTTAPTS